MELQLTENQSLGFKLKKQLLGGLGTFVGLFILLTIFSMLSPVFFTAGNLQNILIQSATNAIIAAGMTFVIIAGQIDLSVGSTLALTSIVSAEVMLSTGSLFLGIVVALILGTLLGAFNGFFVAFMGLPAFIVTLATMWLFRGTAYVISEGQAIVGLPEGLRVLSSGSFLFIPNIVWLMLLTYFVCYIVLTRLTVGRKIYATGDNEESARLSGINVKMVQILVFSISGFLTSVGAIVLMARLNSAQPVAGTTFELMAIAATVIGGTSLTKGGVGGILGTLIGAVFIASLLNGLVILNVSAFWQQVIMGIVILFAVGIDKYRKKLTS
ncbi:ABC transporter permease [Halalkalibacter alkaliphilus]|uniref:ABC transporter permease n=1 Tax=Halalkalibacter alkaliphilus TaxID=2917993 RepID=A0A9X2I8D9_9BACI|nr:ABC transporter permease [Halalkalibacter alkaliphilus]MCL7749917.1 ABC transporter permease [Halalkalibacter alkaliphilus]